MDILVKVIGYLGWITTSALGIGGSWRWNFTEKDPGNPSLKRVTLAGRKAIWVMVFSVVCALVATVYSEVDGHYSRQKEAEEKKKLENNLALLKEQNNQAIETGQDMARELERVQEQNEKLIEDLLSAREERGKLKTLSRVQSVRLEDLANRAQSLSKELGEAEGERTEMASANFLLAAAMTDAPRKILIDIPVERPASYREEAYFDRDARDLLFPEWRSWTPAAVLGSLDVRAASGHFKVYVAFDGNPYRFDFFLWDWAQQKTLCKQILKGRVGAPGDPRRAVWGALPPAARQEVESCASYPKRGYDPGQPLEALEGALEAVLDRRDLYSPDQPWPRGLPSEVEPLLAQGMERLRTQDVRKVNRILLEEQFPGLRAPRTPPIMVLGGSTDANGDLRDHAEGSVREGRWLADDQEYLSIEIEFPGQHALSDWYADFRKGRTPFELVYSLWAYGTGAERKARRLRQSWEQVLVRKPAFIRIPVNESGSVAWMSEATRGDIEEREHPRATLAVSWRIDSEARVLPIARRWR